MGILDKIFDDDKDKEKEKKKADFSDVRSGSSSTAPAPPAATTSPVEREKTYTVVAGDTLSKIAQREYGDAKKWKRIYEANKDVIKNPDLIYPGQTFTIPDA